MGDMLSIGASGVRSYQTALTTTSENIANAGTDGYSRRVAVTREVMAPGNLHYAMPNGIGVSIAGISRAHDPQRAADARAAGSDLARSEAGVVWLERIEGALTGHKLDARMTAFFNAATTLAADPSASAPRAAMLQAAASLADSFVGTAAALDDAMAALDGKMTGAVTEFNTMTANLARVNSALSRTALDSSGRAAILDERDRLLDAMSAVTRVAVSFDALGRANVRAGDAGPVLVQGDQAAALTYSRHDGATSFSVFGLDGVHSVSPNGGAIAGMAEGAAQVHDMAQALGALALSVANGVNEVMAQGEDLRGAAGEPMFTANGARDFTLTMSDPSNIAAARTGAGARDNGNLAALGTLRRESGFESELTELTTGNASRLASRRAVADVHQTIRSSAVAARDSVSGVNLDEEAVDLIRFQQAFQASSRVIQVARETLQSIFDIR